MYAHAHNHALPLALSQSLPHHTLPHLRYVEHRFVRLSDEFIYAICIVKYRLVCADKTFTPAALLAACDPSMKGCASPPPRDWLQSWIDYDQLSSAALRPKKTA